MRSSNVLPAFIIVCLCLAGCSSAESPEPTIATIESTPIAQSETRAILNTNTPNAITRQATSTPTVEPTSTPFPTDTPSPEPLPTTPTTPRPTSSPTLFPSPTPTLYPDVWMAGLLWDEARTVLYVGNSSANVHDAQITYEPLNESVAEEIARFLRGTLVVFYGDYTPLGQWEGHMVVERVEQVNLPYNEDTPLSAVYTHPENLFSFAHPEGWTVLAEFYGTGLRLFNVPQDRLHFSGPGIEYTDPTSVFLRITVEDMSLEAFVQSRLDTERIGEDVPVDEERDIIISEREINGRIFTQIDEVSPLWGTYRQYVTALNTTMVLIFGMTSEDASFAERMLSTLELSGN